MSRILTGVKPTGKLTLGNYIGLIKNLKSYEDGNESFVFIADLHALTLPIEPATLRENSRDIAAFFLAAGLDPEQTTIFLQSHVSAHSEMNSIMQNYLYMGELSRMTQFKDATKKMNNNSIGVGLFAYPVLMASDIILYDAKIVPVGEDQIQHVELTRDLVHRFNSRYGEILSMPTPKMNKVGARIMSLSDPTRKMSKSDPKGDIFLKDEPKVIEKKIMSAVTDSGSEVKYDVANKPGISNLLSIYAALKNVTIDEAEKTFKDYRYGDFKKAVAQAVLEVIIPLQERYNQIISDGRLMQILDEGAAKASKIANTTLNRVKTAIGLL